MFTRGGVVKDTEELRRRGTDGSRCRGPRQNHVAQLLQHRGSVLNFTGDGHIERLREAGFVVHVSDVTNFAVRHTSALHLHLPQPGPRR